jgi:hypothetical protein
MCSTLDHQICNTGFGSSIVAVEDQAAQQNDQDNLAV